ncbi:MAG: sigma-E processing peptidase SpoIIGA [Butyricicoccus sp.]|nr:sigma-E processing peptidase SpoIIGA [Butyricicoccus sp.]
MVIYLDVLAAVNGTIDYLLLLATARLAGIFPNRRRLLGAAAVGALFAVLSVLPPLTFLSGPLFVLLCGVLLPALAFGFDRTRLPRMTVLFLLTAGTCAGIVLAVSNWTGALLRIGNAYYLDVPFEIVLSAALLCAGTVSLLFRGGLGKNGRERPSEIVTITYADRSARFLLLQDTGADLCDPISGRPALLLDRTAARRLLPAPCADLLDRLRADNAAALLGELPPGQAYRFCLLPYRAVGQSAGLLLAFRPTSVLRDGKEAPHLVALLPDPVAGGRYDGLIGI